MVGRNIAELNNSEYNSRNRAEYIIGYQPYTIKKLEKDYALVRQDKRVKLR